MMFGSSYSVPEIGLQVAGGWQSPSSRQYVFSGAQSGWHAVRAHWMPPVAHEIISTSQHEEPGGQSPARWHRDSTYGQEPALPHVTGWSVE